MHNQSYLVPLLCVCKAVCKTEQLHDAKIQASNHFCEKYARAVACFGAVFDGGGSLSWSSYKYMIPTSLPFSSLFSLYCTLYPARGIPLSSFSFLCGLAVAHFLFSCSLGFQRLSSVRRGKPSSEAGQSLFLETATSIRYTENKIIFSTSTLVAWT